MLLDLLRLVVGTVLLLGGAYFLVRGSVAVALRLGVSRVVVGATVVAFGTSMPELLVTVTAGLQGSTGVALGNVLGSNVANVMLVLGLAAVINPMIVHARLIRWEIPVLLAATAATVLIAVDGHLSRVDGILLLAGLAAFTILSPRLFPETAAAAEAEAEQPDGPPRGGVPAEVAMILGGLVGLAFGADLIVRGASSIAATVGVSEFVVGILVVAVGTSLPEMATSMMAAFKNEHEIAVANIVGSNVFNLLAVLGGGALIAQIEVPGSVYAFEFPALIVSSLILVPLVWPRYRVSRPMGALLLVGYATFVGITLVRGTI
ncbi:MAG: calcium/sodium antiporter [Dehalococcoidia bacterium]